MRMRVTGVNGDEILLMSAPRGTAVEIGKKISFLPMEINKAKEFLRKIGLIK